MSSIRLDPDLAEKLRRRARPEGRSLTNLVNLLLRRLLRLKPTPGKAASTHIQKK